MKRLRDAPSSSSALEQTKVLLNDTIKSLTSLEAEGGHSDQHVEIQRTKKPREVDFLYRIHRWLTGGKGKIQTNDNEGQGKGCSIGNHDDRFKRLEKQVEELKQQIGKFDHRLVLNNCEKTLLPFPETELVGEEFKENIEKIMGWLKNSQIFKIGVHGMGGVGKTALLKQVYNELLQDTSTSQPYWATVSHCDSVYKLQGSIAKCFGLDFTDEDDVMKRASILHSTLAKRGNIVLILDDMWQPLFPDEVGIPLGENGCKIILTTRSLEVCRRMGCKDFVIKVEILAEDEAEALFMDNLEDYDELTTEVEEVVQEVLWKCYRLPLAIVTMARRMRGVVEINEWESVLNELHSFKQMDMNDEVYTRLQNSYDSLKDENVKKCFLSSIVHLLNEQQAFVGRNWLVGHWIDEGLLDEIESSEQRLRKARTIINKLVDSCLLEDCDDGDSSWHKLIEAMALCMIQKTRCGIMLKSNVGIAEVPKDELWSEDLVTVSLTGNLIKKIPSDMSPKCPKLTVLNLDNNPLMEVPESFFMHMTALTVLNLSHTDIEILPDSVSKLKSLRALKLVYCKKLAHAPSPNSNEVESARSLGGFKC
uniref:NB-ARC domain-containing protein n=1 Tax=Opuntia streptacantha TaxID=393608 RepID=A0A7C9EB05_OPUST